MFALLEEYSTTVRSSDVGLTWDVHLHAKKDFEVSLKLYNQSSCLKNWDFKSELEIFTVFN